MFSSYGFTSPLMKDKFSKMIPRDESLKDKTCAIVPFAGFDVVKTGEREKKNLIDFGFDEKKIYIINGAGFKKIDSLDYIYVPGGDTFKLLNYVKQINLVKDLFDMVMYHGTIYIGVSAGAYIATQDLMYVTNVEDNNYVENDFSGLGLIDEKLLCHFDQYSFYTYKVCKQDSKYEILTIKNDQLLVHENSEWSYIE